MEQVASGCAVASGTRSAQIAVTLAEACVALLLLPSPASQTALFCSVGLAAQPHQPAALHHERVVVVHAPRGPTPTSSMDRAIGQPLG